MLRRLKQVEGEDRFSADGYAAYRSEVEEASVTIIRPQGAAAVTRALEVKSAVDAQQVTVNRFLKALTGKI